MAGFDLGVCQAYGYHQFHGDSVLEDLLIETRRALIIVAIKKICRMPCHLGSARVLEANAFGKQLDTWDAFHVTKTYR